MPDLMLNVMERLERGEHVILVGAQAPVTLEDNATWALVRVHCDGPDSTWGPLEVARQRVEAMLGRGADASPTSLDELVRLRQRLLDGDTPERSASMVLVEALNRLARAASGRAALVLDAVDAADEATLNALKELLLDARLELRVVLSLRQHPQGEVHDMIATLTREWGTRVLIDLMVHEDAAAPFSWRQLPGAHLLLARACAAVGDVFEVRHVACLLEVSESEVLHTLQAIVDTGAPLGDRGFGKLSFPPKSLAALRNGILPSLRRHWNRRMADIVLSTHEPAHQQSAAEEQELLFRNEPMAGIQRDADPPEVRAYAEVFEIERPHRDKAADQAEQAAREAGLDQLDDRPDSLLGGGEPATPEVWLARTGDHARAAQYLHGAGKIEDAVTHLIAAARQVASRRDAPRALWLTRRALDMVETLPSTQPSRALRARVLAEIGRIQWRGAAVGTPFSLADALDTAERARAVLGEDEASVLRAELLALIAGICYDLGDDEALARAASALTRASRLLSRAGAPVDAARLLNDQAAVLVRFGDPVQAVYLLERSRQIFAAMHARDADDAVATRELAETHHLLARIPTHAQVAPGKEQRAFEIGLAHAARAATHYQRIGDARALARVWETMGRLELVLGHLDHSEEHLGRALFIQRRLSDVTGLARTVAALSKLLLARDDHAAALSLLAESAELNAHKGSPRGLIFNLRAFDELAQSIAELPPERAQLLEAGLISLDDFLQGATEDLGIVPVSAPRELT